MNLCIFAPNFGLSESVLFTCTDAPVPVCPARLAPEEEGAPHWAHLLSKATKQKPLTFYLCFHLKTKTKTLHHTELRFAEKYFSKLRKIFVRQMAICLCHVVHLKAGLRRETSCQLRVGNHVHWWNGTAGLGAELGRKELFSWQPGNGEVMLTHSTFRIKPPKVQGQPNRVANP